MSEKTDNSGDVTPPQGLGVMPSDWEERLAAARAQREKVQKAKGRPKVARPRSFDEFLRREPNKFRSLTNENTSEIEVPSAVGDTAKPIKPDEEALQPTAHPASWIATLSVSRLMAVGFACFFGLGCGIVLSFGAVASMGLFSWSEMTARQTDARTGIEPSAPETYPTLGLTGLASVLPTEAEAGFSLAPLTRVTIGVRDVQRLVAIETDLELAMIESPAPQLGTSTVSLQPVSPSNLQPAGIALAFVRPASFPEQLAPLKQMSLFGDVVPELPEGSTIGAPQVLSNFNPPQANFNPSQTDKLAFSAPLNHEVVHQRKSVVSALKTLPKDALNEIWSGPSKTVAYVSRIAALPQDTSTESVITADLQIIDVPPANIVLARLPVLDETSRGLPTIGAPLHVKPSLADELGLRGQAVERYSLVTYAPTNVSDARIATTTELLEATGLPVAEGTWVNFKVSRTHIRYYSKQDEKVALAIAEIFGVRARDFSSIQDAPPAGRVEVWMQGNRNTSPTARQSKQEMSPSQRKDAFKAQLEDRLVNSLRRGIHLGGTSP